MTSRHITRGKNKRVKIVDTDDPSGEILRSSRDLRPMRSVRQQCREDQIVGVSVLREQLLALHWSVHAWEFSVWLELLGALVLLPQPYRSSPQIQSQIFNQKTLYDAYKKRTKNIVCDMEAYNKAKEADPEFYRDAASLQYGKVTKTPDENIDRMVKELEEPKKKREAFSRRRKFHEEKDVESINDRNEHFNKKIERAFGKYTPEIKNNLERGTALPD